MSNLDEISKINKQADAVLHFLQKLDIEMLHAILEEDRTYQDMEKPAFIQKLGVALDKFLGEGDTFLQKFEGCCNSRLCNYKCKGFSFIGNHTGNYLDMVMEIKDGVVQDMYECSEFKITGREVHKNKRIEIDSHNLLF